MQHLTRTANVEFSMLLNSEKPVTKAEKRSLAAAKLREAAAIIESGEGNIDTAVRSCEGKRVGSIKFTTSGAIYDTTDGCASENAETNVS